MEENPIRFIRKDPKSTFVFDNVSPFAALLTSLAVYAVAVFSIVSGKTVLSRITGIALIAVYTLYIIRYYVNFSRSRSLITDEALLTGEYIEIRNAKWTKKYLLKDITMTFSYSSSSNMTILFATADDYMTMSVSCGYLLLRDKNNVLGPFYAINKRIMELNPKHVNYVRNKKYKRKMPFKVPTFVFESEYDTERVTRFINSLRKDYSTSLIKENNNDI